MKLLRDFKCDACGKTNERYIDSETRQVECGCGALAYRVIGMPRVELEGITGAFPGAHDRWARIREQNAAIKARKEQS